MVKEFDIYLKRRITECDLIVYSLPYRDGLTATNRIILESCIESWRLRIFRLWKRCLRKRRAAWF